MNYFIKKDEIKSKSANHRKLSESFKSSTSHGCCKLIDNDKLINLLSSAPEDKDTVDFLIAKLEYPYIIYGLND